MSARRERPRGMVIWITGLACSGKSTLARELLARLRARGTPCVLLDGDELRPVLAEDLGYGVAARRRCGWRYARLAALLAAQDVHVVVATVSMFEEIRSFGRTHAVGYFEIYLRTSPALRRARDTRELYARREVVGVDLPFEEPASPDVIVDDDGTRSAGDVAQRVWRTLVARLDGGDAAAESA